MGKLSSLILAGFLLLTPVVAVRPATALFEGAKESACEGVNLGDSANCDPDASGGTLTKVLRLALQLLSIVVGVIAVLMLMIGGLKYVMSQGDSNNINSARNTIIYAIIGLVIVLLAQFIVRFVLAKATGGPPTP